MSGVFFQLLMKTLKIIKKEPILLVPFIAHQLAFSLWIKSMKGDGEAAELMVLTTTNLMLNEWIIPMLFLQPFVLILAISIIQNKRIDINAIIKKHISLFMGFLFVSALSKPLYIFGVKEFINVAIGNDQIGLISMVMVLIGVLISFITIFFQPYYILSKAKITIYQHIGNAIQVIYQFKWVVLSMLLYFFLFSVFAFQSMGLFLAMIFPQQYQFIIIAAVNGIQSTILSVFLLRVYLVIRPFINLSYK